LHNYKIAVYLYQQKQTNMTTLERKFRTMYQGDLYTITMKGDDLVTAYYENSTDRVYNPSLLNSLEHYISTGLYTF